VALTGLALTIRREDLDDLRDPDAWRRLAPHISKVANDDDIIVEPGTPVDLVVIAETGTVGRGQLTPRLANSRER
jgi:hypothetical protein